ncbi:MAG: methyltransferase domain-containing protein [Candidatus Solibacter sp.]|nr:methyltransferase domain-containing protein [Candidatus Solibacter sp.]
MRKKVLIGLAFMAAIAVSYPIWKPFAKRSKWFVIASNVGLDSLRRFGLSSEQIGQDAVISLPESQIPEEVKKIRDIYAQYLRYSGWSPTAVAGKRILELGPGFTIGVPLMFAADGASLVAGLDKFVRLQDGPYFVALYSRIRETLSNEQRAAFDRTISLRPKLSLNPQFATYIDHKELADSLQQLGPGSFDMIVSNAVIEEIYDPTSVFEAQGKLLRPGGVMVHRIDLRDYGMFSKYGFHPLEFLTVPDWIYRRMVEGSGQPNRRLIDYYRELGARMGYETEIYATKVVGSDTDLPEPRRELRPGIDYSAPQLKMITDIRPRLLERYRKLSDEDLVVQSMVLVARKPLTRASAN